MHIGPSFKFVCLSLALIGSKAHADDIVPPKVLTVAGAGVSVADGSFTFSDTDLSIGPLRLERIYSGGRKDANTTPFGPRQSHNFDMFVAGNQRTVCDIFCLTERHPIVHLGNSASGSYLESLTSPPVIYADQDDALKGDLSKTSGGAYVYTDQSGTVYEFTTSVAAAGVANSQRISRITFPDGRGQAFSYNASGQLKLVLESTGFALVFDYNGSGWISSVCGVNASQAYVSVTSTCSGAALVASYSYTGGLLSLVSNASGNQTAYGYNGNRISTVSRPALGATQLTNYYEGVTYPWQVTKQILDGGSTWLFAYSGNYSKALDPEQYAEIEPSNTTVVTNPAGQNSTYAFVNSSPYSITDENGRTSSYRFSGGWGYHQDPAYAQNHGSMLVDATQPEGNRYLAAYGGPYKVLTSQAVRSKAGDFDLTVSSGYPSACTAPYSRQNCVKPLWIRDAKQAQTDFQYATHGGVLSEMGPAPVAGAARPLKLTTWTQRYAWIRNASNALVQATTPIWVVSSETKCQTAAGSSTATCDSAAVQTVTTYEYGATGTGESLLVKGVTVASGGTTLRTCYQYDSYARKIGETKPNANLGVCP